MNKLRYTCTMNVAVLTVMALYFFVATTHIFFITQQRDQLQKKQLTGNSIFKRKVEISAASASEPVQVKRPDKSTVEEKNTVSDVLTMAARFFVLLLFTALTAHQKLVFGHPAKQGAIFPRHTYLSLQIIRI